MSKAILVMDMPKSCLQCELSTEDDFTCFCSVNEDECSTVKRLDDCPLRELPKKPDYPPINESSYVAGWNACIDEILKGSEENG